jgi:transcription elongation factor GreB
MSRAFVKEPDGGVPEEGLPERQVSEHPNFVTPAGLRQLEQHVGQLEQRRLELLAAAEREEDDGLAEQELAYVDRDLRYYTRRLESAILVDPRRQPRRMVKFGAAVTVTQKQDGSKLTFSIVGEDEADPEQGKISFVSPLAVALLDARAGATVRWRRPKGDRDLVIEEIAYPE